MKNRFLHPFLHFAGFTLVEMAVVLTVIGVMMGGGLLAMNSLLEDRQRSLTTERMNTIMAAVSAFTQQYYYVPCPGDPAAVPLTGQPKAACNGNYDPSATGTIGIVPYQILGLRPDQVRDAYGQYFTYVVDRNYVRANVELAVNVQNACRVSNTWFEPGSLIAPLALSFNKNPRKARFCCQIHNSNVDDLSIVPSLVGNPPPVHPVYVRNSGDEGNVNAGFSGTPANLATQNPVVLVMSHGRNTYGAFQTNGTVNRIANPANLTLLERANTDNDQSFLSAIQSDSDATYFDDVLMWKTQDQLLGLSGQDSCARP